MITRSSIAFEDFLGSSIAPQVMPPWVGVVGLCEVLFEVVVLFEVEVLFEVGGVPCLVFPPAPLLAHNLWAAPPPCPEIF